MINTKLPQPVALKTELALALGLSTDELLKLIDREEWSRLPELPEGRGTWEGWIDFARNSASQLKSALLEGYRISYTTIGGVRQLLEIKWGLEAGKDYTAGENYAAGVPLAEEQVAQLQQLITVPWEIAAEQAADLPGREEAQRPVYRIAHRK